MGTANIAFNMILLQDLVSDLIVAPPSQIIFVCLITITAISIGFASYLLKRSPGGFGLLELKGFVSDPPKQFLLYVAVVLGWASCGLLFQPWSLEQSLAGTSVFHYEYDFWFLSLSSILLAAFITMPVASLYAQSGGVSDSKAARSLKVVGLSWAGFGLVSLFQVALPDIQGIAVVTESLLFIMIAFALREPTVLGRIISSSSASHGAVYWSSGANTIVLYDTNSDRRNLIESFAREAWRNRQRPACFVARSEVPFYTAVVRGMVGKLKPNESIAVTLQPIEDLLQRPLDGTLRSTSLGENHLIDLGDLEPAESRSIIENARATDAREGLGKRSRIWAVNIEKAHPVTLGMIRDLNPQTRTIDQAGHQDSFSALLGVKHQDISGSKMLLEFEPSSPFESLVEKFVEEFQANVEPVAVFSSAGSPLQKRLRKQRDVSLFSFSTQTSTPSRGLGEEVLLPERDSSLLLDAVDKLLQANHGQHVALALDVFTDLILLQGFEKAYGVLSSVVEMAESASATTLVLLNSSAHDERVLNGVRGLFISRVVCDSNGVRLIRFQETRRGGPPESEISQTSETVPRGVGGS